MDERDCKSQQNLYQYAQENAFENKVTNYERIKLKIVKVLLQTFY